MQADNYQKDERRRFREKNHYRLNGQYKESREERKKLFCTMTGITNERYHEIKEMFGME